eukprot:12172065-Ditylum_brightwellii.AAC.1
MDNVFKEEGATLKEWNESIPSWWIAWRMRKHIFLRCDIIEEKTSSENFYDAIKSFGDSFSGNEIFFATWEGVGI